MEELWQWGIDLIVAIQQVHGIVLDSIFNIITFLGTERFYLLFLPLVFWCVDSGLGARLAILVLFSSYLNLELKSLFQHPRPFDINPSVQLSEAEGYGLPSSHAQTSILLWAVLALRLRKAWISITAIGLIVLISFSRIYLGVHFPTDILTGWLIGGALLVLYIVLEPRISRRLTQLRLRYQVLLAFAIPLVLLLIHPADYTAYFMGMLAGIAMGLALVHRYIPWEIHGLWWHRALRFLVGAGVLFALYMCLQIVLTGEDGTAFYIVMLFVGNGIIGIWVTLGAPWLFTILRIAPKAEKNQA